MRRRKSSAAVFIATAIAIFVAVWSGREKPADVPATTTHAPAASRTRPPVEKPRPTQNEEQAQIEKTLALIERGGPFPYEKDGTVFSNRERRLPQKPRGYYREYTVPTPGASNRGARRIVRGKSGETYYTNDHYRTFNRIDNGGHASSDG